jgi:tRNA(fMet)-specific endonuclease VapC
MPRFMLDTSICVELLRGRAPAVLARMRSLDVDEVTISSITLAELQYGVAKSANPARHEVLLAEFCAPLDILPFDALAAETYGRTRTAIERNGTPIGPLDALIASHALSLHVTLVTNNDREFRRVPGLRVEKWTTES